MPLGEGDPFGLTAAQPQGEVRVETAWVAVGGGAGGAGGAGMGGAEELMAEVGAGTEEDDDGPVVSG